jgi:hypothetical protein
VILKCSVVDKDVEPTKRSDGLRDNALAVLQLTDVARQEQSSPALFSMASRVISAFTVSLS